MTGSFIRWKKMHHGVSYMMLLYIHIILFTPTLSSQGQVVHLLVANFFVDANIQMGFQQKDPAAGPGPNKTKSSWDVPRAFFSEALQFNRCATTMAIRVEVPRFPPSSSPWKVEDHQWRVAEFSLVNEACSRWWFQLFFILIPTWGNDPIWLIFFKWVETTNWMLYFVGGMRVIASFSVCVWDVGMFVFFSKIDWKEIQNMYIVGISWC